MPRGSSLGRILHRSPRASNGSLVVVSLALASCMRFGYEPLEDTGSGLDGGTGGAGGSGGSIGSFAGADGSSDTTADTTNTVSSGSGAGGTGGDASASGTDSGG